jgi:murein DD-endopeptidase MepM/ murein hydrolase activator NlpD
VLRIVLAAAALALVPPVDGPVARPFDPPATRWGPGHRGVDYRVPPGTPVRAAADGVVGFAGGVAGGLHVAVDHPEGIRTSYAYLARVDVSAGQRLRRGDVVGLSGGSGPGHGPDVVHFGVRRRGRYVDPATLLSTAPLRVRLAPLEAGPPAPCWPEGDPRVAATLSGRPGFEPGIHTPASHR